MVGTRGMKRTKTKFPSKRKPVYKGMRKAKPLYGLPKPKKKAKAGFIGLSAPRKRKKINLV